MKEIQAMILITDYISEISNFKIEKNNNNTIKHNLHHQNILKLASARPYRCLSNPHKGSNRQNTISIGMESLTTEQISRDIVPIYI